MPNTPTPDISSSLDQTVHDHRQELLLLMADADRCEDISSGLIADVVVVGGGVETLISNRRVKCDIVSVDWSR